jgi:hypothetical protein
MVFSYRSVASLLLVPSLLLSSHAAVLPVEKRGADFHLITPEAFSEATANQVTDNYVTITKGSSQTSRSFKYLRSLQKKRVADLSSIIQGDGPSTPLIPASGGAEYLAELTIQGVKVKAIVDTGSSDTWLIQKGFKCVDASGSSQAESACAFGPVYTGSFGSNKIPNVNFNISYGDGEFVTGDFGYANVTIAGITVVNQEVSAHHSRLRYSKCTNINRSPSATTLTGMATALRPVW